MTLTKGGLAALSSVLAILISIGRPQLVSANESDTPLASRAQVVSTTSGVGSLETQDAALAAALIRVVVARTSENLAAVADRYYQLGVRDKAMDYYAESLRRNASSLRALDGAARVWRDWGQMGPALGSAYRASYFAPHSAEALNTLGTILQALDQNAAAADAYRRAVSLDGGAVWARSNLCYLALVEGDAELAIAECNAALSVDGEYTPARNNLALAYAATGNLQGATEAFRAAGREAVAHYNTGIVLLAQREYAAAVHAFETAYRIEPSFDAAHARAREARKLTRRLMETTNANR